MRKFNEFTEEEFVKKLNSIMASKPTLQDSNTTVDFSFGYVHAILDKDSDPRDLLEEADHKLIQIKLDKNNSAMDSVNNTEKTNNDSDNDISSEAINHVGIIDPLEMLIEKSKSEFCLF